MASSSSIASIRFFMDTGMELMSKAGVSSGSSSVGLSPINSFSNASMNEFSPARFDDSNHVSSPQSLESHDELPQAEPSHDEDQDRVSDQY